MRMTFLAASALATTLFSAAPAFAGCNGVICTSDHGYTQSGNSYGSHGTISSSSYGSGYSSGYTSSQTTAAPCPSGTSPSSDGKCLVNDNGGYSSYGSESSYSSSSYTPSYSSAGSTSYTSSLPSYSSVSSSSASAPLGSYSGNSGWTSNTSTSMMSDSQADQMYGSGSISNSYRADGSTIVPFSTTSANISNYRVAGMGSNDVLSPTSCPVSVYNPNGGQVLGCYSVAKPAPAPAPQPIVTTRTSYHTVNVVRPVIYVRYPVPTPVPYPVYNQGCAQNVVTSYSRYGDHWPRGGYGGYGYGNGGCR